MAAKLPGPVVTTVLSWRHVRLLQDLGTEDEILLFIATGFSTMII